MDRTAPYEVADYCTMADPAAARFDAWSDHVVENHGGLILDTEQRRRFSGRTRVLRAQRRQIVEFESDAITYRRTSRQIRQDSDESFRLILPTRGPLEVEAGGDRTVLHPGQASLVSMATTFQLAHPGDARARVLSFPSTDIPPVPNLRAAHAVDISGATGAVLDGLIDTLLAHRSGLDVTAYLSSFDLVLTLLPRLLPTTARSSAASPALFDLMISAVEAGSDDPALTPVLLGRQLGWSLRSLQSAAREHHTTPSAMIRGARVRKARIRLRDNRNIDTPIAQIAYASGFGSLSAFYAAFTEAGERPGELRATATRRHGG